MRSTVFSSPRSSSPRRAGRRVLTASAAVGLTLGLASCTIGESGDDAAPAETATATSEMRQEQPTVAPGAPEAGVDQLVLNAQDAPELGLAPVSAEEIAGGVGALEDIAAGVRVDPERCADFSQDAFLAQAEPGAIAIQAGQSENTAYAVSVTTVTAGLNDRDRLIVDCPTMTVTIPLEGTEVTTRAENQLLPLEAPEGVEHFAAITQNNAMDMMGQELLTGNVLITGIVRGIGVSVTVANAAGPVSDAERDTAVDAFAKQVEKIRNA
ncbi:hypothetical protein H483_0102570 [Dietzia sp. UCD-THP]|uniref:hypothetical protein n=1 Tax=Dietzia sp. UCD-THP TaxID=1292020 RepID=UPI00037764E6|nr:hypothetical protein [Dietzia sp. UCD-THP]EYT65110.1 hypothetical protein H483_0102570 [Dietzia sp. UCD-THP]